MRNKIISLVAAAAMLAPAAHAQEGAFVGGLIGGIIGGAIANQPRTRPRTRVVVRPRVTSAERAQVREIQTSLNYFNFPAGTPDGVAGRRTRAAVETLQAFLAMPVTGQLTDLQTTVLTTAYSRGIAGSPDTLRLIANDPQGVRALLIVQRDAMLGTPGQTVNTYAGLPPEVSAAIDEIARSSDPTPEQLLQRAGFIQLADLNGDGNNDYILDTSFSGSAFWCSDAQCKALVFVSTPQGYARNDLLAFNPTPASFECIGSGCRLAPPPAETATTTLAVETTPAPTPTPTPTTEGLGVFRLPLVEASLSAKCGEIGLVTSSSGGLTRDPAQTQRVLEENLCLARSYAIEQGTTLAAGLQGVTPDAIAGQCATYGSVLQPYVAKLSVNPQTAVLTEVQDFVASSGINAAELALTAKICLSHGYRTDDLNIALGSALLLVALGEAAYGELPGHHLALGFGTTERVDLAVEWYDASLSALGNGATVIFAPGMPERRGLLLKTVSYLTGTAGGGTTSTKASVTPKGLPTFTPKPKQ